MAAIRGLASGIREAFFGLNQKNVNCQFGLKAAKTIERIIRPRGCKGGARHKKRIRSWFGYRPETRSEIIRKAELKHLIPISYVSSYDYNRNLSLSLWNARSFCNKLPSVTSAIYENGTDVFIVTESWLSDSKKGECISSQFRSLLSGYEIYSKPRAKRKGGGVAVIARQNVKVKTNKTPVRSSFESMDLSITVKPEVIHLIVIYRPPPSKKNGSTVTQFFQEFTELLESAIVSSGWLVIVGDFNFHVEDTSQSVVQKFLEILHSFGLSQRVTGATHQKGHTLDLLITRDSEKCVVNINIDSTLPSDHSLVHFLADVTRPRSEKVVRLTRPLRSIDQESFTACLVKEPLVSPANSTVDQLTEAYNAKMLAVLNKLAPEKKKCIVDKPRAPWYSEALHEHKVEVRKFERRFRKEPTEINRQLLRQKVDEHSRLAKETSSDYYRDKIANSDQKQLFGVIDEMVGEKRALARILPQHDDPIELAKSFADFFNDKVVKIRERFDDNELPRDDPSSEFSLDMFSSVTESDIVRLITSMNSKSCALDPCPTSIVKLGLEHLAPFFAQVVNSSFSSGKFPDCLKKAIVRPLLKKSGLVMT